MRKPLIWIQALLLATKIFGVIDWSWWWVLSPTLFYLAIWTILGWATLYLIAEWAKNNRPESKKPFSEFLDDLNKRK